ncbi:hypothetical protein L195_g016519 [Trifolium pratense]|uniref:Uncharacterized protein n=1 Tax=Trifolium pratense TaxID=57577 RepID=A0A2K3MRH6_TRIPR|nr:hypothetical protein L195_g016519 [Trifolium pratense]
MKVCELVDDDGKWNWSILQGWLPAELLQKIAAIIPHASINRDYDETCLHVLRDCVIARNMWMQRCKEYRDADKAQRIGSERPRSTVLIGWKPLIDGWVKLNIDGACKGRIIVGCGGIFRNNREDWLGRVEICVEYEI